MRRPSTSTDFFVSGCSVMDVLPPTTIGPREPSEHAVRSRLAQFDWTLFFAAIDYFHLRPRAPQEVKHARPSGARADSRKSAVRRHEDRQEESGEVMQCLVDPDQPPEP